MLLQFKKKALFIRFRRSNNLSADAFFYWHFNGRSLNHALAIYLKNPYFVIKSANCKNQFLHTPKYFAKITLQNI